MEAKGYGMVNNNGLKDRQVVSFIITYMHAKYHKKISVCELYDDITQM